MAILGAAPPVAAVVALIILIIASVFTLLPLHALKIGSPLERECSTKCESKFCDVVDSPLVPQTPFFRYGRYCGILYGGCNEETPCDGIDECCMRHDNCIADNGGNYLKVECNRELQGCVRAYGRSGEPSFEGSTCDAHQVVQSIDNAMEYAILFGKLTT